MIHLVSFSGGKDSTAMLLHLKEKGIEYQTIFCDTGWEHPKTYEYVQYINEKILDGKLITLKSSKYDGMKDLVKRKKRSPSAKARFCTEELKIKPVKEYLDTLDDEVTQYVGIRADESESRSKMKPREWSDFWDCWIERPIFRWTSEMCFDIHKRHNIEPNPLYKLGSSRVGCFPCIMTGLGELKRMNELTPEVWDRAEELEAIGGQSFFPPDKIPPRWRSQKDEKTGKTYPSVQDVKNYVLQDDGQLEMFKPIKCMSIYNLCE